MTRKPKGATNIGYIKERKQFTTVSTESASTTLVLQIQDISKNESNSQPKLLQLSQKPRCYKYRIYQRTKAIHNRSCYSYPKNLGATNIGYIKERKQFTTLKRYQYKKNQVLQIQDISKNESNSQLDFIKIFDTVGATNIGYIKERKQFTTLVFYMPPPIPVLQIQDISKNESNSQH